MNRLLTIKGAPEILDDVTRKRMEEIKNSWASQGRRVLLLARKALSSSVFPAGMSSLALESEMQKQASSGLTLVGLVGIVDPPRPEIPDVIDTLRGAGIRIFMVRCFLFGEDDSELMCDRSLVILRLQPRPLQGNATS
jgi:sodium/potassium-transporting ATPase subunit alpha